MKKALFLATATVLALMASAQTKSEMANNARAIMPEAFIGQDVVAVDEPVHLLSVEEAKAQFKVAPKANVKAWYNRPAGTMWQTFITTDGKPAFQSCYAPYLSVHPWKNVVFESASTDATSQKWDFYHRKKITTHTTTNVTDQWGCQTDTIPVLTAYDASGAKSVYTPAGYNSSLSTKYASYINAYVNYIGQYQPGKTQHFWSSPKFFGSESNRDGTKASGAYIANVADASGQPAGQLLGKNRVNINGLAIAAEAPVAPYVINRVGLRYQGLSIAQGATVPITATIYKLDAVPAYTSDGSAVFLDEPTEVLATATINVNDSWLSSQPEQQKSNGTYAGILPIVLSEPLEVNSAILVCVEGYNVEAVNDNFTSVYSSDYYDEGHGEVGYLKTVDNTGKPLFLGMRGGALSSTRYSAPAVLLDVERRFLDFNKAAETGLWNVPVEGGDSIVDVFSYLPSYKLVNLKVVEIDKDGAVINDGQAPSWITAVLSDQLDPWGNPVGAGIVHLTVNVAENPGLERAAQVEMSFVGAKLVYTVNQAGGTPSVKGDVNGDGKVDVADVNIIIDIILENATIEQYPAADVTGDGKVDVADVNAVIDIILGL